MEEDEINWVDDVTSWEEYQLERRINARTKFDQYITERQRSGANQWNTYLKRRKQAHEHRAVPGTELRPHTDEGGS